MPGTAPEPGAGAVHGGPPGAESAADPQVAPGAPHRPRAPREADPPGTAGAARAAAHAGAGPAGPAPAGAPGAGLAAAAPQAGAGPAPLGVDRAATGHAGVDALLERLADADRLTPDGHVEVYEDVHRGLRDTLAALDGRPGPGGPRPPGGGAPPPSG